MAVISLSSIPSRFAALERVLAALCAQDIGEVAIELYLPRRYRRFPDHDGTLPRVPPRVEIVTVDEDLGPATKILHAVERHRAADPPILYCDDDVLYAPGWARGLFEAARAHPGAAVAAAGMNLDALGLPLPAAAGPRAILQRRARDWRYLLARGLQIARYGGADRVPPERKAIRRLVRRTGLIDIAEGYGVVVVRPSFFDAPFREIPPVLWAVDDVWISGNLARRGIPILAIADAARLRFMAEHHAPDALHQVAIEGAQRFDANRRCALYMQEHLGVWR